MDIAKTFRPETILLWQKVAEHPEAQRILGLFPSAKDYRNLEYFQRPVRTRKMQLRDMVKTIMGHV